MDDIVIKVDHLTKLYKLYNKPSDRLKESLGLSKKVKYKEHYALDDVNIEIRRGETIGIIGTNGSGKSTILKIITGVLNPTSGSVTVNGRISALLELGAGFNPEYTGIENVYLNGTMIGFTREEIDEKLDDILEFADIGEFVNQPVKTYSSGMFVRLAFAVAINIEPEILVVDEALSVGDVFFQAKCFHKFEEFKKQGKTILFVTHDMGSIKKYCDRAILLNHGKKIEEGSPAEIIDIYKKVLVNQYDTDDSNDGTDDDNSLNADTIWKNQIMVNPNISDYGNGMVNIVDFCIFNKDKKPSNVFDSHEQYTVMMKVRFNDNVNDPIFALTIKDLKGTDIVGTNTMYEDINTGKVAAGDVRTIYFTQEMRLARGEYLISLGVTGYMDGSFVVYNRLYDAFNITVVTSKDMVGYCDLESSVRIENE